MKNKLIKLSQALQVVEPCEKKRAVQLVYLAIVVLGLRIPEVANYFKLPENKVQFALTVCGITLQKDYSFRNKMHTAARIYNVENNVLNLVS